MSFRSLPLKRVIRVEDMVLGAGPTPGQPASDSDIPPLDGRSVPTLSPSSHPGEEVKRRTGRAVAEVEV
jgi:hypothetical protein